jgi:hypothetical protein
MTRRNAAQGGGLAIDDNGSRTTFHSSINDSIDMYACDIVFNIADVCDDEKAKEASEKRFDLGSLNRRFFSPRFATST